MAKIYAIVFFLIVFATAPVFAHAASLNFSPPSGSHTVGSSFSVSVYVESASQAMNAASGIVSFPWDKLEVVSLSKQGSIFSLWPTEPSFSNSQGTVSFEGIALNPGYTGTNGKLLTITFRARSAGMANVSFSSGSILANDGTGTNILNGLRVASYTLGSTSVPTPTLPQDEPVSTGNTLGITSTTHPDQSAWYANNTPEFSWNLPDGVLEVRTLIGKSSSATPSVSHNPPISKKKVDELPDGTYHFSLQTRTVSGWSTVSRYRVNIDTTPPKPFTIAFPHGNTGWEPQPVVFFNTTDDESGISHYEIKVGNDMRPFKSAPFATSNPYVLPPQLPGTYTLLVMAVDNAGNVRNGSAGFTIESIDAPTITYYPEMLEEGDILKVRGTTYPDSDVTMYIREGDTLVSEEYTRSNTLGDFAVVATKWLKNGVYTITARIKDARGAQSVETSPLTVSVRSEFVTEMVSFVLKYLSVALLALLAFGVLVWVGLRLWFRIPRTIARMRREAREAEKVSEKALNVLREDVLRHIARLKKAKRRLTVEETEFLEQFGQKLKEAEDIIIKEIQDISNDKTVGK
ncbi:MAG: cohesin domain-containing protein [Patescibacteria group bacterium]